MLMLWCLLQLTDISGTINDYTEVVQVSVRTNRLVVADPTAFAAGDTVLLIQIGGAAIDTNRDARYGTVRSYGHAGEFERNIIDSVVGSFVYLHRKLLRPYDASDRLQLVSMPSYQSANVTAPLTCPPWNGKTGGVLAFTVRDTLFLNANITADGKGLAGGAWNAAKLYSNNWTDPPNPRDYATNDSSCCFSSKGEGIALSPYALGFAPASNGGGGAGTYNHGGGGGAHVGCGGAGADARWWVGNRSNGLGGFALSYRTGVNRVFMGGGGGATEGWPIASTVGDGGSGGGIVVLRAPVIVGDGAHVISSCGSNGVLGRRTGSGGGAGGALLIVTEEFVNVPKLRGVGGAGGQSAPKDGGDCGGPGGGGGGGAILLGTLNPLNLNQTDQYGGAAGQNLVDTCDLIAAEEGCAGTVFYNATITEDTTRFVYRPVTVAAASPICVGDSTTITIAAIGTPSVYSGQTLLCAQCISLVVAPVVTTMYTIVVDYKDGGFDTSYVTVNVNPLPVLKLPDPKPFCFGDSAVITAPDTFAVYVWSTGDTTSSIVVRNATTLNLTVIDNNGCTTSDELTTQFLRSTSIDIEPTQVQAPYIGHCLHGEMVCAPIRVVNITDSTVVIDAATMRVNAVISVPQAQFPKVLPPRGNVDIWVCASGNVPGDYTDTLVIAEQCGIAHREVRATIEESPWFTRCAVRITSDGELESFVTTIDVSQAIVTDLTGRIVHPPLQSGVYVVRTPSWSGVVAR